jgi:apolipoprotein N-acyltransferase
MVKFVLPALVCGAITSLAFDPLAFWPAALVGVAGVFVMAHRLADGPRRRAFGSGVAYGFGLMAPLIWWMNAVSPGAYVALTILQAFFFGLLMLALRSIAGLPWWPAWFGAVWVLVEFARSNIPFSGFPWGRLAHTVVDSPLDGYVRLVGMPATSGIVAALAAGLAWWWVHGAYRIWLIAGVAALTMGVGAVLPTGLAGSDELHREAEIALVQGNVPGEFLTWKSGEIFDLHAKQTRKLVRRIAAGEQPRPDVVLWPENSTDVDPGRDPEQVARIKSLSAQLGAPILVGGIFDGPTPDTAYNAGVLWTPSGPRERYIKRTIVPYGEYVPFRQVVGPMVPSFDRFIPRDMLPGDEPGVIPAGDVVLGDAICWDIAYDNQVRSNVQGGAQVLVVQTSNASFTGTYQPEQQFKISRLRAIETGRWVLVPSTNGISGIIDASGRVVARAPLREPATLAAAIPLAHGTTLGVLLGPWLEYLIAALGVVGIGLAWRRR